MRALLKGDDLPIRLLAPNLGSGTHSGCVPADNDQSFLGHKISPEFKFLIIIALPGFQ
jgi:hypothetical protein